MKLTIFSTTLCVSVVVSLKNESMKDNNIINRNLRGRREKSSSKSDYNVISSLHIESRIVGGNDADASQYPFFAWWDVGCGATLIHRDLLLTSAHCIHADNYQDWPNNVWIGELEDRDSKALQRSIVGVSRHPAYDPQDIIGYDFLILLLDEPTPASFEPVSLNSDPNHPSMGDTLTAIGFGSDEQIDFEAVSSNRNEGDGRVSIIHDETYTLPDGSSVSTLDFPPWEDGTDFSALFGTYHLHEVDLPFVTHESCNVAYVGLIDEDSMLCAGAYNKDTCDGDSGGPLLDSSGRQVGISSFGAGCGDADYPGVYSRTSFAYNWIQEQICLNSRVPPLFGCHRRFELHINIVHDIFPHETGWLLDRGIGVENVLTVPAGTTNKILGTETRVVNMIPGFYTFMMADTGGDGLCCQWGEGSFALSDSFGNTIQHDGEFEDLHIIYFEISESGELTEVSPPQTFTDPVIFPPTDNDDDDDEPQQLSALSLCYNAREITIGETVQDATTSGTLYDDGQCGGSMITEQGVWHRVTGTGNVLLASTCSYATFDTQISVFAGWCSSLSCVGGNDDACSLQSEVSWATNPGQFYYVVVHGWNFDPSGEFELIISEVGGQPNPQPQLHEIRVDIFYDLYPSEVSWLLYDLEREESVHIVYEDTVTVFNELESVTISDVPDGKYLFVIVDSAVDGICCDYGEGYIVIYEVMNEQGDLNQIVYLPGDYGATTFHEFEL